MLPQTLDKAATAFPRFLHSYIVCICDILMSPVAMKQANKKCLTTKIGCKTEKDALMKENSAKASKMCILPFTQLLPLPLSNEREACLPALLRGSELLWGDSMPLHIDGDKQPQMAYKFFHDAFNQSQKNPVSASAMLTGKFLRIRKVFATSWRMDIPPVSETYYQSPDSSAF